MRSYALSVATPVIVAVALLAAVVVGQAGDEPAPRVRAADLIPADMRKGPHHTVDDTVTTEGFYHRFTVSSDYGQFEAVGLSPLTVRLDEVRALAALDEVSKSGVFIEAAGGAVINVGKSAVKVATDPVGSAKGIGGGVKRLGINLGRMSKRAVDSVGNDSTPASQESGAETAANAALGVSSAMRRWARKVGADPYTTNPVLRQALKDIGQVDAAGSIATKIVLPIPTVVTTTATVGDLVWGKDPEELRKINEQRLEALGVSSAEAGVFFKNRGYTLTAQTRFIAALDAVKARGSAGYVAAAGRASGERHALFFVESAEMLQRAHATQPVTAILDDSQAMVAARGGRAIVLLPLDDLRSTADTTEAMEDIDARAKKALRANGIDVRLTGRASPLVTAQMKALGWTLVAERP